MKKLLIVLLAVLVVFAFVGCKEEPTGEVKVKDEHLRVVATEEDERNVTVLFEFTADKDYGEVEYGQASKGYNNRTKEWLPGGVVENYSKDVYYEFIRPSSHPTYPPSPLGRLYRGDRVRFEVSFPKAMEMWDDAGAYTIDITLHKIVIRSVDNPENSYTYTFE